MQGRDEMPERAVLSTLVGFFPALAALIVAKWGSTLTAVLALLPTTLLARLLYHHRLVKLGRRRMWSWDLAWELPTAALCAVLAGGMADYIHLGQFPTNALAGVVGWLGPRGLEVVVSRKTGQKPTMAEDDIPPSEMSGLENDK